MAPPNPQLDNDGSQTDLVRINALHRCHPSRIRRDSPAFSSDGTRPAKSDRCPAFLENGIIISFVADYSTFLPRNATK